MSADFEFLFHQRFLQVRVIGLNSEVLKLRIEQKGGEVNENKGYFSRTGRDLRGIQDGYSWKKPLIAAGCIMPPSVRKQKS
jgi:hypothetical protein